MMNVRDMVTHVLYGNKRCMSTCHRTDQMTPGGSLVYRGNIYL